MRSQEFACGFSGYAFCKAHSTAYGVEAYQAAWLKCHHPAEFMAGVLSNGKGFYSTLVYSLECRRIGLKFLPPCINEPGPLYAVHGRALRVPLTHLKGLAEHTAKRLREEHKCGEFLSMKDFFGRVRPAGEEIESMIRSGAFDSFGESRTAQFWEAQTLIRNFRDMPVAGGQSWLLSPEGPPRPPEIPLCGPTRQERLEWETDLFDFAITGHPLELYSDVAWETYCPVSRLGDFLGQQVITCGLIVETRIHHQVTGEPMKFLTLADYTGMVDTELFAPTYRCYGLATVRYPVLEIEATVEPFENGKGFSLQVWQARKQEHIPPFSRQGKFCNQSILLPLSPRRHASVTLSKA